MNSLRYVRYEYFRSIIFECMNLLTKVGQWTITREFIKSV
jgi:hypothetical protein